MSKQSPQLTGDTLTPAPSYLKPATDERVRPQYTGSSRTPYEYELDDIRQQRHAPPRGYGDDYYRWRRGIENEMPHRPPAGSKASHVFATCCCGSPWGSAAWVIGAVLLAGGFTALLVKTLLPHQNQLTPTTTALPSSIPLLGTTSGSPAPSTVTVTTSSPTASVTTSLVTSVSVSTWTSPEASTVTFTPPEPVTKTETVLTRLPEGNTATFLSTITISPGDGNKDDDDDGVDGVPTMIETVTITPLPTASGKASVVTITKTSVSHAAVSTTQMLHQIPSPPSTPSSSIAAKTQISSTLLALSRTAQIQNSNAPPASATATRTQELGTLPTSSTIAETQTSNTPPASPTIPDRPKCSPTTTTMAKECCVMADNCNTSPCTSGAPGLDTMHPEIIMATGICAFTDMGGKNICSQHDPKDHADGSFERSCCTRAGCY